MVLHVDVNPILLDWARRRSRIDDGVFAGLVSELRALGQRHLTPTLKQLESLRPAQSHATSVSCFGTSPQWSPCRYLTSERLPASRWSILG